VECVRASIAGQVFKKGCYCLLLPPNFVLQLPLSAPSFLIAPANTSRHNVTHRENIGFPSRVYASETDRPQSIADESISANQDLVQHKLRYVLYKLEHNEMVVDKKGDASTSEHTDFIAALPQDKCRYATYVFEYGSEQGKRSKLLGVVWMPDAASVRVSRSLGTLSP
jgi:hypothetical protein